VLPGELMSWEWWVFCPGGGRLPALINHADSRRIVEELRTEKHYAVNDHCSLFVNRMNKLTFRICVNQDQDVESEHKGPRFCTLFALTSSLQQAWKSGMYGELILPRTCTWAYSGRSGGCALRNSRRRR